MQDIFANLDIINNLIRYLSIQDTMRLLSCNKNLWSMRHHLVYRQSVIHKYIKHLEFSGQFLNLKVMLHDVADIPTEVDRQKVRVLFYNIKDDFHADMWPNVYHLTFGLSFNKSVRDNIPNKCKHLAFHNEYDHDLDYDYPVEDVIHLNQMIARLKELFGGEVMMMDQ
jgi:hypothetical protein